MNSLGLSVCGRAEERWETGKEIDNNCRFFFYLSLFLFFGLGWGHSCVKIIQRGASQTWLFFCARSDGEFDAEEATQMVCSSPIPHTYRIISTSSYNYQFVVKTGHRPLNIRALGDILVTLLTSSRTSRSRVCHYVVNIPFLGLKL